MVELNGKYICLQCKYATANQYFTTYDSSVKLVQQYPIVFTILPQEYVDKNMVLEFLKANGKLSVKYQEGMMEELKESYISLKEHNCSLIVDKRSKNELIKNNAIVDETIDLGEFINDVDVMVTAVENDASLFYREIVGKFNLTPQNYNEKCLREAVKKCPKVALRLYDFWNKYLDEFPKVKESIKCKYGLNDRADFEEIVMYKCFDIIGTKNTEAVKYLFDIYSEQTLSIFNGGVTSAMPKLFAMLTAEQQNAIVSQSYLYAKFVDNLLLSKDTEQRIALECPIAGDILSNEAILRYNLKMCIDDNEIQSKCLNCSRCDCAKEWNTFVGFAMWYDDVEPTFMIKNAQ